MNTTLFDVDTPIISLKECRRFVTDCMLAVGTPKPNAEAMADLMIEADYRGFYSHGMNRIEMYVTEIKNGACNPKAVPKLLKETPATAWVDGNNGLGVTIGDFCMDLAMQKAKHVGIGIAVCKGSNHFGIAGMYSTQALKKGLIGLAFTNTFPIVAPTRSNRGVTGTNPIALAAPALDGDSFVLDMATSVVAIGKVEMKRRENSPIPPGWMVPETGALCPLGGDEDNASYKGYGLGVLVEIFCGILGGSSFGTNVRAPNIPKPADLGQCFIAIDPKCFAPGFEGRLSELLRMLRDSPPIDPEKPVWVAGDPERLHMKAVDEAGGIRYLHDQLVTCNHVASTLKVRPLQPNVPKLTCSICVKTPALKR